MECDVDFAMPLKNK